MCWEKRRNVTFTGKYMQTRKKYHQQYKPYTNEAYITFVRYVS